MKVSINEINNFLQKDSFIEDSDKIYQEHVNFAVDIILKNKKEKPIVLLCGPSGAGKTTTAQKISQQITKKGISCSYLSMDDYFKSLSLEDKNSVLPPNLETPERVDFDLFNNHLEKIINNEQIVMPKYDFINSERIDNQTPLFRDDGIIIVEGIHALNTNYVKFFDKCTKLYINVGCDIILNNNHLFKGRHIRLLRRICRDRVHRGRDIKGTIEQFHNVSNGEDLFIKPYKDFADYVLSTFSYYEMSCYKFLLDDILNDQFQEIVGSEEIFKEIVSINPNKLPNSSHIKEFV